MAVRRRNSLVAGLAVCILAACVTVPEPLTSAQNAKRTVADKRLLTEARLPLDRPLGLGDAMAYALANNLDVRIASLDAVIARGAVDLADLGKLPTVLRTAGFTYRNPPGSTSDKVPGDQERRTASNELSWSILDFGVSYIRAKQAGNDALAADERRRRVANSIVNEVRLAFWQAQMGSRRMPQLRALAAEVETAMQQSKKLSVMGLQDPLVTLNYQDGLLELLRQIKSYEVEVAQSKHHLMRLLNAYTGLEPSLAPAGRDEPLKALRKLDRELLEDVALATRGELREAEYARRNKRLDVISAYLAMAPTFRLRAARIYDSTTSLIDNHWYEQGYSWSFNLFGVWSGLERAGLARKGIVSAELRRLTLGMAIMEQVAVSRDQLNVLEEDYDLARETSSVRDRIYAVRNLRMPFNETDELEKSRAAVSAMAAQVREDRAYSALQKAYGDLLAALGVDQFPADLDLADPERAAREITRHLEQLPDYVLRVSAEVAMAGEVAAKGREPQKDQ